MLSLFVLILPDQLGLLGKLKAELELLQSQYIIAPVTEATEWCAPIVVVPNKDLEKICMCVDLSHLNHFVI